MGVVEDGGEDAGVDKVGVGSGGDQDAVPDPAEREPGAQQRRLVTQRHPGHHHPPHQAARTRAEQESQRDYSEICAEIS